MQGQPVVQTLARFGELASCQGLTADRAGNIYAAVTESVGKPTHVLLLKPGTNELVQLPMHLAMPRISLPDFRTMGFAQWSKEDCLQHLTLQLARMGTADFKAKHFHSTYTMPEKEEEPTP
jgi:hypothetical protein